MHVQQKRGRVLRLNLTLGLAAMALAGLALVSGAGAKTTAGGNKIDVSSKAAAAHYLRSLHVNPTGLVIQRGKRNYAGPRCPGKRWSCTSTRHPVIQVATAHGRNVFQCARRRCAVVQAAPSAPGPNLAKCVRTTGITQSCSITQTSATVDNQAVVVEVATKTSGLTQNASQTAQIVQTATGGASVHNGNTACVLQQMVVNTTTVGTKGNPVTATLDGHQSLSVSQDSAYGDNLVQSAATAGSGSCTSDPLTQTQTIAQTATGGASITQNENAAAAGPNASIDIEQNQNTPTASGANTSNFAQTSTLSATAYTPNGPVSQTQSTAGGGLDATVNQFSHGLSTSHATQTETETEHAQKSSTDTSLPPNTSQVQHGPVRCCSNQADNPGDTMTVDQHSTQTNDTQQNQNNTVQADCTTTGSCTAGQQTSVDGSTTSNSHTGSDVSTQITCSGTNCTPTETISNTDVAEFGFGGMRGDGTGSITVAGVSGTVTKALLYWNGPTNSSDPGANASVTFADTPVTGTNIGFASDNCWGFQNSQSYRADVTSLVSGDGTYSLSDFVKPTADINGVALIVFYDDGNAANNRNVVFWNGNDSNVGSAFDPQGWDKTLGGVQYPGGGSASLDFVVSDGQTAPDDALVLNGSTFVPAGAIFSGDSTPAGPFNSNGDLWDVKSFDLTPFLSTGSNDLHLTTGLLSDCTSLVVLLANTPAAAPPPIQGPSSLSPLSSQPAPVAPARPARRERALPSTPRSRAQAGTARSPLLGVPRDGALVRTQAALRRDR